MKFIQPHWESDSLKSALLSSFLVVIVLLFLPTIFFILIRLQITSQYQTTLERIVYEYDIIETVNSMVTDYSNLIQTPENVQYLSQYLTDKEKLKNTLTYLDDKINNQERVIIYNRQKNTAYLVQEYCDKGIALTQKRDFSQSSNIMEQINRSKNNVQTNTADLVLAELSYLKQQQKQLSIIESISWTTSIIMFLLMVVGCVLISIKMAEKISNPLIILSQLAHRITDGNLELNVPNSLINQKNEIGSLSNSFNLMLKQIRETIAGMSQKTEELERANKLMVDRELKMAQMKQTFEDVSNPIPQPIQPPQPTI